MRYAVSFVIYKGNTDRFLIVKRPKDDPDLADVWSLPAGGVKETESYVKAVQRAGREKLGCGIDVVHFLRRGNIERRDYTLHTELYEAAITYGSLSVPQLSAEMTQYQGMMWGTSMDLSDAAEMGSLCCRLYLDSLNRVEKPEPIGGD